MQRTTKKERQENARQFYQALQETGKGAVIIERKAPASTPYVTRTQFKAVCSVLNDDPKVIAEDAALGKEGCFYELLNAIKSIPQTTLFESGFKEFLQEKYGIAIPYDDGTVMMFVFSGGAK